MPSSRFYNSQLLLALGKKSATNCWLILPMNCSSHCWRDYLLPRGPPRLKMLPRQKWWVLIFQCKEREELPGYTWVLWAPLHCQCLWPWQTGVIWAHPPSSAEECFFQKQEDEGAEHQRLHAQKITAFPAVISSILQAAERQGADAGTGSVHLGVFTQSSWLTAPLGSPAAQHTTPREENKTSSSMSSIGSTFVSSEGKQSD